MLGLAESKKVVVVGIPGVGKTTVVSKVVEKLNALNKSVSVHSFGKRKQQKKLQNIKKILLL